VGKAWESSDKALLLWKFERIGTKITLFFGVSVGLSWIASNWSCLTVCGCCIEFVNCSDNLLFTVWMTCIFIELPVSVLWSWTTVQL
jgi:hypothetical protein